MSGMYLLLANILAVIHGLWISALLVGTVMAVFGFFRKRQALMAVYSSLVAASALSTTIWGYCLFTIWEIRLRVKHDPEILWDYTTGFMAHYLKQLGIVFTDQQVFFFVYALLFAGMLSIFFWSRDELNKKFKSQKFFTIPKSQARVSLLVLIILIFGLLSGFQAFAGPGPGPPNCTNRVDLSVLVPDYISEVPTDPVGETTHGAGYEISQSASGAVTITAPDAELGVVIEVSR